MSAFEINGGKTLRGEIIPQGAKNEALQVISAVLLTEEKVTISNIPDIKDVNKLIELLGDLGVKVEKLAKDTYTFQAKEVNLDFFQSQTFKSKGGSLRGSIMILGPMLARFGKAAIPNPEAIK
jgi:UDP-N-acetylglucosamine 1-carboxyvinyltransferase